MLVKEPAGWTKKGGFYSNLLLILSFTGNKQDWPKAKNKLFIWVSQQRRIYFYNTRLQQTFPAANEISFNSGLLKVILEDLYNLGFLYWFSFQILLAAEESISHISRNF